MTPQQIGTVRSAFTDRKEVPHLGAPGAVEILPQFADALHRIEKHSHFWVMAWMDGAAQDVLEVTPRGVSRDAPDASHGVFSVRSPARLTPIGLTAARLERRDGLLLHFDRLDFIDGTPVIDLKPYFVSRDAIFAATNQQVGKPKDRETARESLRMQAIHFHGTSTADLELAVDLFTDFRAEVLDYREPTSLRVTAPLDRPVLVDALSGMTRCTLGRGTLNFGPPQWVRFDHDGERTEYELTGESFKRH